MVTGKEWLETRWAQTIFFSLVKNAMEKPTQPLPEFPSLGRICRMELLGPHLKIIEAKRRWFTARFRESFACLFIYILLFKPGHRCGRFQTAGRASGFLTREHWDRVETVVPKSLWTWVYKQIRVFKIKAVWRLLPLSLGWHFPHPAHLCPVSWWLFWGLVFDISIPYYSQITLCISHSLLPRRTQP